MITIGLGEYAITDSENEIIITHSLGSCVALVLYCPVSKCTSMAHFVLPERDIKHGHIHAKEAYYAKDFLPKMLKFYLDKPECSKRTLRAFVVGGSVSKNPSDIFKIGERNVQVVIDYLEEHKIHYVANETLGSFSRTVSIDVDTGILQVKKRDMII